MIQFSLEFLEEQISNLQGHFTWAQNHMWQRPGEEGKQRWGETVNHNQTQGHRARKTISNGFERNGAVYEK